MLMVLIEHSDGQKVLRQFQWMVGGFFGGKKAAISRIWNFFGLPETVSDAGKATDGSWAGLEPPGGKFGRLACSHSAF